MIVADLKREGVEDSSNTSLREDSHHALELQRHQVHALLQQRTEVAHRSRLRRARIYLETAGSGSLSGSSNSRSRAATGTSGPEVFGAVLGALKHTVKSGKEQRAPGKAQEPMNMHRPPGDSVRARL